MKKLTGLVLAATLIVGMSGSAVCAGNGIDVNGKHYNMNIIGKKKGAVNGDYSNGSSLFIPLVNVKSRGEMVCDVDGALLVDDTAPTWLSAEPVGTKIYFVAGDSFAILDRDGTDANGAKIQVPVDPTTKEILFDIYVRVLGKPKGCMNIAGYAYDANQGLWFWSGSVYLNRTKGKQVFINANDLFDVWYCTVNIVNDVCADTPRRFPYFLMCFLHISGTSRMMEQNWSRCVSIRDPFSKKLSSNSKGGVSNGSAFSLVRPAKRIYLGVRL